jgi:putative Mn2+ efflux pump MntP
MGSNQDQLMTKETAFQKSGARRGINSRPLVVTLLVTLLAAAASVSVLHAMPGITTSAERKILGIAVAVGLDVLALSIAVGIMQLPWNSRIRLGLAFSGSEVIMQVIGYGIGTGAGELVGVIANYAGFAVLAGVGLYIFRESYSMNEAPLKVASGWGLLAACASVSLDSLGIGVSLPGVPLPLVPLLVTVAVSTIIFTAIGLAFGAQLGHRYKRIAERSAGAVLIVLAIFFTAQHLAGWGT